MLNLIAQATPDMSAVDKWGLAGLGIVLAAYLLWQHRVMFERIAPSLEKTNGVMERTSLIMEKTSATMERTSVILDRVSQLLDDIEHKRQ